MKVAIVHDWLNGMRGGEKVLELICGLVPEPDLYTLICEPDKISPLLRTQNIKTSFIQNLPGSPKHYRMYLPFFPTAIESLDLRSYDLVISTSHCVAKGAIPGPSSAHLCYCFTPMRYIWDGYWEYEASGMGNRVYKLMAPWISHSLRIWDVSSSPRVDEFLAISTHVAHRIKRYYGREARIVFPPVDTEFFTPSRRDREDFLLTVSALVPYKRLDLAIAFAQAQGIPLKIAGAGPEEKRLRKRVQSGLVEFLGHVSDEGLLDLYRRCRAFMLPGVEDFGLAPVEAQACGAPVLAQASGGALDIVIPGETGVLFREPSLPSMQAAWEQFQSHSFDEAAIRSSALRFSTERFTQGFATEIQSLLGRS